MKITRKMLSDRKAPYIQSLMRLIETQSKSTLAIWAIDYAEQVILPLWGKSYPDDLRPENALSEARQWLAGAIKLPQAKATILACHAAAREAGDKPVAQAAARAVGQSAATIHAARHCIGLALYGALAAAYDRAGTDAPWESRLNNMLPPNAKVWKLPCAASLWRMNQILERSTGIARGNSLLKGRCASCRFQSWHLAV